MNKTEYINLVEKRLKKYNINNIDEILDNYEIIIDEILEETNDINKVIEKLGSPDNLAEEYAEEFGYILQNEKSFNNHKYFSNTILNIIKIIMILFEICLTFFLITTISLMLIFGLNSRILFHENMIDEKIIVICNDNDCIGVKGVSENNFEKVCFNLRDCFEEKEYSEIPIPLFPAFLISNICTLFIMFLVYILGIRNISKTIKSNRQYNQKNQIT